MCYKRLLIYNIIGDHQTNINEKEMTSQQAVSQCQSLDYCTTELHNYPSNEHVLCLFCGNQISEYKSLGSTTCCSKSVLEIIDGKYVCINCGQVHGEELLKNILITVKISLKFLPKRASMIGNIICKILWNA